MPTPEPGRQPGSGSGSGSRLWLLRHAQVDERWVGRAYGDLDVPLSEEGRATTRAVAAAFGAVPWSEIVSSPLERALELGRAIADRSAAPLEVADGLREIRRGDWQGRMIQELHETEADQVAAFYADPWSYRGHGGECDAEVLARAWPVIAGALGRHARGTLCLTTHYNVIRVVAASLLGIEPARSFALRIDPGRGVLFADRDHGWTLLRSNVTAPTPQEASA